MLEIIGTVPHWIVHAGTGLFFVILLTGLLFTGLIQSPDTVPATLMIDAGNRPQEVIARKEGRLSELLVKTGQPVQANELLGFMESTADHRHVLELSRDVDSLQAALLNQQYGAMENARFRFYVHYGELQPAYEEFYRAFQHYRTFTPGGANIQKIELIKTEIDELKLQGKYLLEQQEVHRKEFKLSEKEFSTYKELALQKVIPPLEFDRQELKHLRAELPLHAIKASLATNRLSLSLKRKELLELEHQRVEQYGMFLSNLQRFQSELDNWEREHVLRAERNGTVVFQQQLQQNQRFQRNEPIMYILDRESTKPYGVLTLGQQAYGKVQAGQQVLVRLEAYPVQEYGLIKGEIEYISSVMSGDSVFTAKVQLSDHTTYNKRVDLQFGLLAQAEVVTEKQSLLTRILNPIRDMLVNR